MLIVGRFETVLDLGVPLNFVLRDLLRWLRLFGTAFVAAVDTWANEEVQHGMALGRWAHLADPAWDFEAAFARFRAG